MSSDFRANLYVVLKLLVLSVFALPVIVTLYFVLHCCVLSFLLIRLR